MHIQVQETGFPEVVKIPVAAVAIMRTNLQQAQEIIRPDAFEAVGGKLAIACTGQETHFGVEVFTDLGVLDAVAPRCRIEVCLHRIGVIIAIQARRVCFGCPGPDQHVVTDTETAVYTIGTVVIIGP